MDTSARVAPCGVERAAVTELMPELSLTRAENFTVTVLPFLIAVPFSAAMVGALDEPSSPGVESTPSPGVGKSIEEFELDMAPGGLEVTAVPENSLII